MWEEHTAQLQSSRATPRLLDGRELRWADQTWYLMEGYLAWASRRQGRLVNRLYQAESAIKSGTKKDKKFGYHYDIPEDRSCPRGPQLSIPVFFVKPQRDYKSTIVWAYGMGRGWCQNQDQQDLIERALDKARHHRGKFHQGKDEKAKSGWDRQEELSRVQRGGQSGAGSARLEIPGNLPGSKDQVQILYLRSDRGIPIRLPGLPSSPKNCGLEVSASLRLVRRETRPSSPVIGLASDTCIATLVRSVVILDRPEAIRQIWRVDESDTCERPTINTIWLVLRTTEKTIVKHLYACDCEPFRPRIDFVGIGFDIVPLVTSTSVEENRDEE